MHFYKDTQNKIHALDAADFEYLLPAGCIEISSAEANALLAPPDQVIAARWASIKAERDRRRFEGGVKVGGHWFLSNQTAVSEYVSMLQLGAPDTTVLRPNWRTMCGVGVPMTPELARQVLAAGFAQVAAIDDAAMQHKAALEASADPATYDFTGGWPKMFGE